MRDAGHRTPDIGQRTAKKAKIIYPPPRGVDIIHKHVQNFPAIQENSGVSSLGNFTYCVVFVFHSANSLIILLYK